MLTATSFNPSLIAKIDRAMRSAVQQSFTCPMGHGRSVVKNKHDHIILSSATSAGVGGPGASTACRGIALHRLMRWS